MKHLLLLLLSCIPMFASAQTLTETQKQEALQCATKFCNLLTRFSNGERTLNLQINALCSGADCSAYDDIKTNKETTLRNYLMAIQQKYPTKLQMQLSQPTFSDCEIFQEYDFSVSTGYGTITGSQYQMTELPTIEHDKLQNVIIVFNIKQMLPSLGKSIERMLIYSQKSGKITAFVCNNSPILSYSKGLDAFAQQQYKKAIAYFEEAINNGGEKFSRKRDCYMGSYVASVLSLNLTTALKYANLLGDIGCILNIKGLIALQEGRLEESYNCYKQLENELSKGAKSLYPISSAHFMLGMFHFMPKSEFPYYDSSKGVSYLKKCIAANGEKAVEAAYMLYIAWIGHQQDSLGGISDKDMTYSEALSYLRMAANKNYPPTFLPLAIAEHFDVKDKKEALKWYEKSAKNGNAKAMALLGKVLTTESEFSHRKEEGIKWLKKSLEGEKLEISINEFSENIGRNVWPSTREDVLQWLRQVSNTSTNNHTNISNQPALQSDNTITNYSHSNGNNNVSNSSSSYHRYRKPFNSPDDGHYTVGLSVGYVQKQWSYKTEEGTEKSGYWDDSKHISGIQAGIRIEPLFKYGFGLETGLYYEYYYSKSKPMTYEGEEYEPTLQEHAIYLPIHLEYRLNFSKNFQLFFYGGIGLDYGLSAKLKTHNKNLNYEEDSAYEDSEWKKFNTSLEYGGGMRICRLQFNLTMSKGLINMSEDPAYKIKQNKNLMCSLSVMF